MKQKNLKQQFTNLAFVGVFAFNFFPKLNSATVADNDTASPTGTNVRRELRIDARQDAKSMRAWIRNVKITAISSSFLTVDNGGTSVTVNILSNTQLRRKFWGKSNLSEFSVGDMVSVVGRWTDSTKTAVNAVLIRDESIQKRNGAFFGTVKSLTSGGFVFTTIKRGDETVTIGSAKIVDRKEGTLSAGDIKVGDRVRVKGLWDSNLKTITEVTQIKDFSLPPRTSSSPSPSATP